MAGGLRRGAIDDRAFAILEVLIRISQHLIKAVDEAPRRVASVATVEHGAVVMASLVNA